MKVLFIGGIFDSSHNKEIICKTKTYVEYAANNFQRKIIEGIKANGVDVQVISAPFLGAYPMAYTDKFFRGFDSLDNSGYTYVHFNNIWGIRNHSRKNAIKNELNQFITDDDKDKLIIVYTPHTPFIQAACYAKKKDSKIKICLVIPDLPQYMNLADKVSPIYKILKKYDVKTFLNYSKKADTFVVLTDQMKLPLNIGKRPYIVVEGIYEPFLLEKKEKNDDIISLVYTGKLDRSFGIMNLVKAFSNIHNEKLRLIICGSGEEKQSVEKAAKADKRIIFRGQVSSEAARQTIVDGDILINPRQNNTEYTKYSFPSKIIDYLSTRNTVIAYKLDGIPECYKDFIYFIPDNETETLSKKIIEVLELSKKERIERANKAIDYLNNKLSKENVGRNILLLNGVKV